MEIKKKKITEKIIKIETKMMHIYLFFNVCICTTLTETWYIWQLKPACK